MERWSVSGDRLDLGRQEQNLTRDVRFRVDRNDRRALGARAPGEYGEYGDGVFLCISVENLRCLVKL
jgi:hypothetical protein